MFEVLLPSAKRSVSYQHQSEVMTYVEASVPGGNITYDTQSRPGQVVILDKDGNEVGTVSGIGVQNWQKGPTDN